jgi:hypothetical protein
LKKYGVQAARTPAILKFGTAKATRKQKAFYAARLVFRLTFALPINQTAIYNFYRPMLPRPGRDPASPPA